MARRRKRDVIADARRFNDQSSYTRSWQVSPVGGPSRLHFRGAARVLPRIFICLMTSILLAVLLLAIFDA